MKRVLAISAAALLAAWAPLGAQAAKARKPSDEQRLSWFSKYDEALAEAKRTGRPLLLEFRCVP